MSHHQRTHCPNCRMPYPLDGGSACPHCGRNRDARSFEEIAASGQAARQYFVYIGPLVGFLGLLYGVSVLLGQWKAAPIRAHSTTATASAPASYPVNSAAREARRKAEDARFWAAKARREAQEVVDVNAPLPQTAFGSTAPIEGAGDGAFVDSSPSVGGARVVVTSGPSAASNPAPAPTPNPPPSGGLSGKPYKFRTTHNQ